MASSSHGDSITGHGTKTATSALAEKLDGGSHKASATSLMYPPYIGDPHHSAGHYMIFTIFDSKALHGGHHGSGGHGETTGATPTRYGQAQSTTKLGKFDRMLVDTGKRVTLYMPESLTSSYGAEWELGDVSVFGGQAVREVIDQSASTADALQKFAGMGKALGQIGKYVAADPWAVGRVGVELLQELTGNEIITNTIQAQTRRLHNPHMEWMFRSVAPRTFEFEFNFTPKSEKETEQVHEIIKTFKLHMHPEIEFAEIDGYNGYNMYYVYPSEFDITFYSNHRENKYLHRISTCALTEMGVDYTGAGGTSFFREGPKGAAPTNIKMKLGFKELEIMTRQRINQGF